MREEIKKFDKEVKDTVKAPHANIADWWVLLLIKGWCVQCRYPHPGERKNEWSFSGEDDLKQWVLTADSDWGEGYRWLLSPDCFFIPLNTWNDELQSKAPWHSLSHVKCCTVWDPPIGPLCSERRAINEVKLNHSSSNFIPVFRVPADGRIQNAGYVNISSVPKTSAFAQVGAWVP